jgi:hypothetical protein
MSVTVRARHEYRHPLETVWAAFSDPDFYQAKFEGVGHRNVEVISSYGDAGGFSIEIRREVPLDVPGILKGLLGEWNEVLQNESWNEAGSGYQNDLEIRVHGVPAVMTGTMMLSKRGQGCVNEVAITIRASVPLIGGKLEQFAARDTETQLEAEYEFIREYLEANRGRG